MAYVVAGGSYTGEVLVRNAAGDLVDPDADTLNLRIFDPEGQLVATVLADDITRVGLGHYSYAWATDEDFAPGEWQWLWDAELEGANLPDAPQLVVVLPAGSLNPTTLLTVDQLRQHVTTTLGDEALQRVLDAANADLLAAAGPLGVTTLEMHGGRSSVLLLPRRFTAVSGVVERYEDFTTTVTLATNDWHLIDNGWTLVRSLYGTNPPGGPHWWAPLVAVTGTVFDDTASRVASLIELVKVALLPVGLTSRTIGAYSESFAQAPGLRRSEILGQYLA
jgi:hypothetical protein